MKLKNKRVLVYGLGDSGRAVIKLLQEHNARVWFYDDDPYLMDHIGFERHPEEKVYDFVVVSPGVKIRDNKLIENFVKRGIDVMSEIDFAYLLSKGKIIAVTGTNGKTTVCMLTNKILYGAGYKTFLCGNIGLPFSAVCEKTTADSVVVCEVSNLQLEISKYFRSDIACILNVKPDHIDRHGTFEEYKRCKAKLAQNLKRKDLLILNLDDEESKKMVLHKNNMFFTKKTLKKGVFIKNNQIYINKKPVLNLSSIHLRGEKNLENVLACVSICSQFKVTPAQYEKALENFLPASHRIENVGTIDGVTYIDDSKATNVASTIACVEAFKNESFFLLLGGLGKDINYDEFFSLGFSIKQVVCFGKERDNIKLSSEKFGYKTEVFEKFDDAVKFCLCHASAPDYVLLSPACASFDEFGSYAERGDRFKSLVLGHGE